MPRPGDTVSLSMHPTIQLSQYTYVKAAASITRRLGSEPESDLQDMREELSRLYAGAVLVELGVFAEVMEIVDGGGSLEDLADWAKKKANGSEEGNTENREVGATPTRRGKLPKRRKAARRSAE